MGAAPLPTQQYEMISQPIPRKNPQKIGRNADWPKKPLRKQFLHFSAPFDHQLAFETLQFHQKQTGEHFSQSKCKNNLIKHGAHLSFDRNPTIPFNLQEIQVSRTRTS